MKKFSKRAAIVVAGLLAVGGTGAAVAGWVVGDNGSTKAYAKAQTVSLLGTVIATPTANLYPGASNKDAKISVTNPNGFAVTVTDVADTGTITVTGGGAGCPANHGVSFNDQSSLSLVVPAGSPGEEFTLNGAVSMALASHDDCQGARFDIPVVVTGIVGS